MNRALIIATSIVVALAKAKQGVASEPVRFHPKVFAQGSAIWVESYDGGDGRFVRAIDYSVPNATAVFAILGKAHPIAPPRTKAPLAIRKATLMIGSLQYRACFPMFPARDAPLVFSVAPESSPNHISYLSLDSSDAKRLSALLPLDLTR